MRGRHDCRGLASLFDAFMFLAAMMAVCGSLCLWSYQGDRSDGSDMQSRVQRAHEVLLSSALQLKENGSGPDASSPWVRIPSLVIVSPEGDGRHLVGWAIGAIEIVIQELLGPGWGFEWSWSGGDARNVLVAVGALPPGADLYASSIGSAGAELGDGHFLLSAWRA